MKNIEWEEEDLDAVKDGDLKFWCDESFCVTHSPNERVFWFRDLVRALAVYEVDTDTIIFNTEYFEIGFAAERQVITETVDFIRDVLKLR